MTDGLVRAIGLMSGTSLDGIDAASIETDGAGRVVTGPSLTIPYDETFRARLRGILGGQAPLAEVQAVEHDLTLLHEVAVTRLLAETGIARPEIIGFHGHTILHRPQEGRTWQIGDGALLAERLGLPVCYDFRSQDVASGGQGAPFVPAYHRALSSLLEKPIAVLNIGGVANVTWIGPGEEAILAFDTGPGNALLDDWALRHTGRPVDEDGALAAQGVADRTIVQRFLAHPFFAAKPPKSLDRDDFAHLLPYRLAPEDGAATLVAITAGAIAKAATHFPAAATRWLVAGGGRRNSTLMAELRRVLDGIVEPVEAVGWNGDALEAEAFAYLAVRSLRGLPLSFPGTTGVGLPQLGGKLAKPGAIVI
jgi:anhydro-N-acetylmuramic acid kinase